MTTATPTEHDTTTERALLRAFALREKSWKLGFTVGHGHKPRERTVAARELTRLLQDIARATKRCALPETAPVVRCYEAGRDGFWRHRFFQAQGITNHGVDSSSIAVHRRQRRELETLKQERASTTTRLKGLLRSQGIRLKSVTKLPEPREALRL